MSKTMIRYLEVVLPFFVSVISTIWAIVSSRKANKQNKEIEQLKTELNQKTHIRESLFDYEFESYVRLMGLLNSMLDSNLQLFPHWSRRLTNEDDEYKRKVDLYKNSIETRNKFVLALGETKPFIDEEIYKQLSSIQADCMTQIILYEDFMISDRSKDNREQERDEFNKAFKNQDLLMGKYDEISWYIKGHLSNYYH